MRYSLLFMVTILLFQCTEKESRRTVRTEVADTKSIPEEEKILTFITPTHSAITFSNNLTETEHYNYLTYNYFYNGSGVGVADFNGNGLVDIYFGGNQVDDILYFNQGDLKFQSRSPVAKGYSQGWTTGVSVVDINTDGAPDIYVSRSGPVPGSHRKNMLLINDGKGNFTEQAELFGLADSAYSTQGYFFDADGDEDLDMYLLNHRTDFKNNTKIATRIASDFSDASRDKLYINENGYFQDKSQEVGIMNKAWGLSANIGDFNEDGLPDIYVANDFLEPDLLYINKGDGTFINALDSYFDHISFYSMGSDFADINNDLKPDLYVTDMSSSDHKVSKQNMASMSNSNFWDMVRYGYHYQYMHNMLQLNQGNGHFSEIAQYSGVSKTDWSWAALIADINMDGYKDIFVTNGIKRDVTNNDWKNEARAKLTGSSPSVKTIDLLETMPSRKIPHYLFRNERDLTFTEMHDKWGLHTTANGMGAILVDLDNDGDRDIVINNLDEPASLYRNDIDPMTYVKISLKGPDSNPNGIGSELILHETSEQQSINVYPARGYLSSYLGDVILAKTAPGETGKLEVIWPDGRRNEVNIEDNTTEVTVDYASSTEKSLKSLPQNVWFTPVHDLVDWKHKEDQYDDFEKEILLPHRYSRMGPALAMADTDGDGTAEIFFGGAAGQPSELWKYENNKFKVAHTFPSAQEITTAAFIDFDDDGDPDLYVGAGSNQWPEGNDHYRDRIYFNEKGEFVERDVLPPTNFPTGVIAFNKNKKLFFIGNRMLPQSYPMSGNSMILKWNNGKFEVAARFDAGMVVDALWLDNQLVIASEWEPIRIFDVKGAVTDTLSGHTGWWRSLTAADINNDGKTDLIAGNIGLNNKFQPSKETPLHVFAGDFDENGSHDVVLSKEKDQTLLPVRGRECSSEQVPKIAGDFPTFREFAKADLEQIYGGENLKKAYHKTANEMGHIVFINNGKNYITQPLQMKTQIGPLLKVVAVKIGDKKYLIGGGNEYMAEVETTRYDAQKGFLIDPEKANFLPPHKTGLFLKGDVKNMIIWQSPYNGHYLIAVLNNDAPLIYKINDDTPL